MSNYHTQITAAGFLKIDQAARAAAQAACRILRECFVQREDLSVSRKGPDDFVSRADFEAERAVVSTLRHYFPDALIIGEESGRSGNENGSTWVIDPLDGTANFIRGIPHFAVSIALMSGARVVYGLIVDPLREEWFSAARGCGSWLNDKPILVSRTSAFTDAYGATGFPFKSRGHLDAYMETFRDLFPRIKDMRRCGAAALDLAYTACGRFDFFWEAFLHPWDFLAGKLIVEEAGGRTGDFNGQTLGLCAGSVVAANQPLFSQLLKVIQVHFPT